MLRKMHTFIIKSGMPSVEEARRRLIAEVKSAQANRLKAIKIVHGYGSTGRGGRLREAIRTSLLYRRRDQQIGRFVYGERWTIFDPSTREFLNDHPEYRRDNDLNRDNPGITIVEVRINPNGRGNR